MLLAWLVLPLWLRGFAQDKASALLGRSVTIEALHINPLTLTVGVDGLVIGGPANDSSAADKPLLRLAHGEVNAELVSLWRRAPVVGAIELQAPELNVARLANGRYDIDDLLTRFNQPTVPAPEPQRFALYNLRITGGRIRFDDRPKARVHEVTHIELGVPFLSNLDDAVDVKVEPHLSFQTDDTSFDTGAQATIFSAERAGVFTLKTGDIDLSDWLPYLPAELPVRPVAGAVALDLTLQFKAPTNGNADVALRGGVRAKSIRLEDAAHARLAELGALTLQIADLQPLRHRVSLSAVDIDGLVLHVARDAQGRFNLPSSSAPPANAEPTPANPWQLALTKLAVHNTKIHWRDEAVKPAVQWATEAVQLQLDNLRWPPAEGATPARLNATASLSNVVSPPAAGASAPQWKLEGEWTAAGGQLQARGDDWPLAWVAPYTQALLKPRLEGSLGFEATAKWQGEPGAQLPVLQLADLHVADFAAAEPGERQPSAAWKQLRLTDLEIDPAQRKVTLGSVAWDQPAVRARRNAAGEVDLAQWWMAQPAATTAAPTADAPAQAPWQVHLQEAAVDGGRLSWRDAAAQSAEPVALDLQRLKLSVQALQWPATAGSTSRWQLNAQVPGTGSSAPAGTLSFQGDVGLAPLAWRGTASVVRFPLHTVAVYAGASLPLTVGRADVGWAGQVSGGWAAEGLSLALKGEGRLTDLRLYPRGAAGVGADELLSWQSLELPALQVALSPGKRPRVEVGEARLNDFYAQLMVNEAGRFNLTDLNAAPANAATPEPAASAVPATTSANAEFPLDLVVGGVLLKNGRVDFSDHFVRPNYSAALSELSGKLGGFRSGSRDMATLDLRGRVAGTAQLEVSGALNPTARPLAMDVKARATDLELAPLSPYAGKYAGYAIERGKLTMDVSYRIGADGRLDAANQIVLNQLTFGERIESPDATKLPVLLAVALLKDRDGVIDLNLPIGGSLNDPDFSIGGVVLKLIGNLLAKAVTAPFALLSGGGSEDLSAVEFKPGSVRLADTAAPQLDKVAKALTDRPSLRLTVTASADPQGERDAMQAAWLDERLAAELRKDKLRAGETLDAPGGAGPVALPPEEHARLVRRLYSEAKLPNKPRNLVGLAKDIPVDEMEALLRASHVVSTDNARELALQRGLVVRDALIAKGLPGERLFLAAPKLQLAGEDNEHWTPRVQLSLETH